MSVLSCRKFVLSAIKEKTIKFSVEREKSVYLSVLCDNAHVLRFIMRAILILPTDALI
jgi:hypothetical protein